MVILAHLTSKLRVRLARTSKWDEDSDYLVLRTTHLTTMFFFLDLLPDDPEEWRGGRSCVLILIWRSKLLLLILS